MDGHLHCEEFLAVTNNVTEMNNFVHTSLFTCTRTFIEDLPRSEISIGPFHRSYTFKENWLVFPTKSRQ